MTDDGAFCREFWCNAERQCPNRSCKVVLKGIIGFPLKDDERGSVRVNEDITVADYVKSSGRVVPDECMAVPAIDCGWLDLNNFERYVAQSLSTRRCRTGRRNVRVTF